MLLKGGYLPHPEIAERVNARSQYSSGENNTLVRAYGTPDAFVVVNSKQIRGNVQLWENRTKNVLSSQRAFQDVNIEEMLSEASPAPAAA